MHPRNVVANHFHLPAGGQISIRRPQHGKIGLSTRRRERTRDESPNAVRRRHADNHHVLGQPAFVSSLHACKPQRVTRFGQHRVAAVIRVHADNQILFRKMADVSLLWIERADAVNCLNESRLVAEMLQRNATDSIHQSKIRNDVRAVRHLNSDASGRTSRRTEKVRHDIHHASLHAAVEQVSHLVPHKNRVHPVVARSGVVFAETANERAV